MDPDDQNYLKHEAYFTDEQLKEITNYKRIRVPEASDDVVDFLAKFENVSWSEEV